MRNWVIIMVLLAAAGQVQAKKNCTEQPKDKWMKEEDFKKRMEGEGYQIRKFKQPGSCYEIYGTNKDGKKVEVYFNPVNASVVKEKFE